MVKSNERHAMRVGGRVAARESQAQDALRPCVERSLDALCTYDSGRIAPLVAASFARSSEFSVASFQFAHRDITGVTEREIAKVRRMLHGFLQRLSDR